MKIENADVYFDENCIHLTLTVGKENEENIKNFLNDFPLGEYEVNITRKRKNKRSNSINAYFWVLLDQIAAVLHTTKEELYKEVVRESGVFTIAEIKTEAFLRFKELWAKKGLGWFCEKLSEHNGKTEVICYYGTSVYDSSEMNRIVDRVVEDAKACGLQTATPSQLQNMKKIWEERIKKESFNPYIPNKTNNIS